MSAISGAVRGRKSSAQTWLIVLLVVAIVVAGLDFALLNIRNGDDRKAAALTTQVQVDSQLVAKFAIESAGGNINSFQELESTRNEIDAAIKHLNSGDPATGMPAYGSALGMGGAMTDLTKAWTRLNGDLGKITANKDAVLDSAAQADTFSQKMPLLNSRINEVVNILQQRGSTAQIYDASQQMVLGDRLIRRVGDVLQGGENSGAAADGLTRDSATYGSVLTQLAAGVPPEGKPILADVQKTWSELDAPVHKLIAAAPTLVAVKDAANQASLDSGDVLGKAKTVADTLGNVRSAPTKFYVFPNVWIGVLCALAAVVLAVLLAINFVYSERRRSVDSRSLNERNQQAIMRLLDEMGSLAEGDLTVKATVTEDITGAIADSVNFAVEALRSLVTTINETAVQVSAAAQETQATAMHLAEAAQHQAQQITSASAKINEMAVSIDQVSKNSADSAEVAQRSVQIASNGAAIVRQTISGMDSIREQIQETSKRIKRLGESSQEIGSIVELINDIAEQTNILALNAAIQAASAGEAGRGFAVVADEVQRLAERASGATKRIETLVQTIQSDTNEAVSSMEQTTTEVVNGARLAEDAGTALGEIEQVSGNLAGLIQGISSAAKQQSAAATNITSTMHVIQEITAQTSVGASQTAESIGNLAQLAQDLRRSVADFKLPA
ncbi:MAG TPA: methyl-accepting chemotaxis protein [Rhodanobacteraceae bacterium]|nr:methyl-accepting chemotaxis protein [Rhodanobacteraceae bacterium]